jgi:hypothetical protein
LVPLRACFHRRHGILRIPKTELNFYKLG